jgi:hypothetical protein
MLQVILLLVGKHALRRVIKVVSPFRLIRILMSLAIPFGPAGKWESRFELLILARNQFVRCITSLLLIRSGDTRKVLRKNERREVVWTPKMHSIVLFTKLLSARFSPSEMHISFR